MYTTGGITKLCEGLKGSSVTSLRCALGRACSPFCQCPLTRLLSHRSHPAPRLQYWGQQHRGRGRLRARRHPQGDADHHPGVSHRPRLFAFVSAPIDTPAYSLIVPIPPIACSISDNDIGDEGASALAAILKETQIQELECTAAPERSLLCQCPLTRLLSHRSHPAPRLQYWGQQHRGRGRLRARRHPQGDADHHPGVSHRPRLFAFVSAPTLSPSPLHPSLAVSETISSETRAPLRSPPSSRRRRSPTWSAPPPECLLLCQRPLTFATPTLQFGRQPALWPRHHWPRHLHHGGHHQAVRGAQGKRRNLA